MLNTICACIPDEKWQGQVDEIIQQYAGKSIAHVLRNIGESPELSSFEEYFVRTVIHDRFPFKLGFCRNPSGCCGMCTNICSFRCVFDVLNRTYMFYMEALNQPDSPVNKNIIATVEDPNVTYDMLRFMIEDIINVRKNKELSRKVVEYGQNPYKFDYGPITIFNYLSPKRRVRDYDKDTGVVNYLHWPKSGLCPFAEPRITIKSASGRKSRRV